MRSTWRTILNKDLYLSKLNRIKPNPSLTWNHIWLCYSVSRSRNSNHFDFEYMFAAFFPWICLFIPVHEQLHNINTLDIVTVIYHIWFKRYWLCLCQIIEWQCVKSKWCPAKLILRQWRHTSMNALCCCWVAVTFRKFDAFITISLPTMSHHDILSNYVSSRYPCQLCLIMKSMPTMSYHDILAIYVASWYICQLYLITIPLPTMSHHDIPANYVSSWWPCQLFFMISLPPVFHHDILANYVSWYPCQLCLITISLPTMYHNDILANYVSLWYHC